jgi:hypothetical protein
MRTFRLQKGESLVSVMVAALLMALVVAAIGSLAVISTSESTKLQSKVTGIDQARLALDRMGRLIRMARNIGDVQGGVIPASDPTINVPVGAVLNFEAGINDTVPVAQVKDGTACNMSASFPSIGDPYYGPSGTLKNTTQWPWGGAPYTLSNDTLVVQVPTFDNSGYPNKALKNDLTVPNLQALDTYVYRVVPDPQHTAQIKARAPELTAQFYKLEVACFPAEASQTNIPANWQPGVPNTVLKGIVGPLDANGRVVAFQYVNQRAIAGGQAANSITTNFDDSTAEGEANENNLPLFTGVMCNFQIMSVDGKKRPTVELLRSEMFLRNNASATIMGTPPSKIGG